MGLQAGQATFRSYLVFWSGQLVSLLGSSIAQFVIVWWVTLETESAVFLSISSFAGFAPMVLLTPIAGVYADRWNRKALIAVVDFLQALATVALILLFWYNMISVWHVIALSVVRGVFQAFHSPAVSALVPLMVPRSKLSRINGLSYLLNGVVNLVGPVVAALLMEIWAIHEILWIDAVTFVFAVIPLLMITIPSVRKEQDGRQEGPSFKKESVEGLAFIRGARGFLPLFMTATVLNFLIMPLATLIPYFVKFDHLGEATDLAFVSAFFQGGMLVGGLLMSVIKGFKKKMVTATIAIYFALLGYALTALTPTGMFWFMAIGGSIMGFCLPIDNVLIQTIVQTTVPVEMFGRVNSVMMALANIASPAGMAISGPIAETVGTANLFLGCSLLGGLSLTLSWLFTDIKHIEEQEKGTPDARDRTPTTETLEAVR